MDLDHETRIQVFAIRPVWNTCTDSVVGQFEIATWSGEQVFLGEAWNLNQEFKRHEVPVLVDVKDGDHCRQRRRRPRADQSAIRTPESAVTLGPNRRSPSVERPFDDRQRNNAYVDASISSASCAFVAGVAHRGVPVMGHRLHRYVALGLGAAEAVVGRSGGRSDRDPRSDVRGQRAKVAGVAGNHCAAGTGSCEGEVGVHNVGGCGLRE